MKPGPELPFTFEGATCPCLIEKEQRCGNPRCWHFGGMEREGEYCYFCFNGGRVIKRATADPIRGALNDVIAAYDLSLPEVEWRQALFYAINRARGVVLGASQSTSTRHGLRPVIAADERTPRGSASSTPTPVPPKK